MKMNREAYLLYRARTGITPGILVNRCGIPHSTLARAANGMECRPETIGKIARGLGVSVELLIDDKKG